MKKLFLILLLLPFAAGALELDDTLGETYWSIGGACNGHVYHFDARKGTYQIYSRLKVKDKKHGEYISYQYSEGKMTQRNGARYALSGEGMQGKNVIDFGDMSKAVITSSKFGRVQLGQCDADTARHLIIDAEMHFLVCPKNTLNCKSK